MKSLFSKRQIGLPSIIIFIVITCLYCDKASIAQPTFERAYERWQSYLLHDYTIDQKLTCFCFNSGVPVQVSIRADTVADVAGLSDSTTISRSSYITVDSLFAIIRNATSDSLVVRFNVRYGYPEYLDVNPQLHPVDGGYLYETSNLRIP